MERRKGQDKKVRNQELERVRKERILLNTMKKRRKLSPLRVSSSLRISPFTKS